MGNRDGSQGVSRRQVLRQGLAGAGALAVAPLAGTLGPLAVGGPPPVITRAQWGADESLRRGGPDFAPLHRAIVHHTVTPTHEHDPAGRVRAIYRYHVVNRRWSDIAYNFLVDGAGRIYEGRWSRSYGPGQVHDGEDGGGRGVIGAHARGHNTGSLGIAVLGTYDGHTGPSDAALGAVAVLVAWKLGPRGIDPRAPGAFMGHRDVVATGCPGDGVHRRLPELRERAAALAQGGDSTGSGGLLDQLLGLVVETPRLPLLGGG